ncbi:MAG: hypothetical protein GEV11_04365 [Streptosporangiales bacterium]|nr:hypothetical protein [Streptosporangiales bacterium]
MDIDPLHHLRALASELDAHGLRARVVHTGAGPSFVRVINPGTISLAENVTCAPFSGAHDVPGWYYWWSWGERMHGVDDPAGAATKVARVLEVEDE